MQIDTSNELFRSSWLRSIYRPRHLTYILRFIDIHRFFPCRINGRWIRNIFVIYRVTFAPVPC